MMIDLVLSSKLFSRLPNRFLRENGMTEVKINDMYEKQTFVFY